LISRSAKWRRAGGNALANDGNSEKEILSEFIHGDHFLKIVIRCADDARFK